MGAAPQVILAQRNARKPYFSWEDAKSLTKSDVWAGGQLS